MLEDGEMVEANKGYRGEYYHVWTLVDYEDDAEKRAKEKIRARQDAIMCYSAFLGLSPFFLTILNPIEGWDGRKHTDGEESLGGSKF